MNALSKNLLKMLTAGILLLTTVTYLSSAKAELRVSSLEFSPVRVFATANIPFYTTYSGGINFELGDSTTELAVPFLYVAESELFNTNDSADSFVVDLQWRKFDTPSRNGGYIGVLARGVSGKNFIDNVKHQETDFGLGIVAGFRRTISTGFYWGANVSLVAFADEPAAIDLGETDLYRQKVSMTFDFLKIGYQF